MTDEETEAAASEAIKRGDYREAESLLTPLADRNSGCALTALGWMHEIGGLGPPDMTLARHFYEKAFSVGSVEACFELGRLYFGENDFSAARAMLEKARAGGVPDWQGKLTALGENLAFQAIQSKSYREALEILEPQKTVNSEYTLISLGWLYHAGLAGLTDKYLARSFYERAVEIGSVDAYYRIGMLELDQANFEAARAAFSMGHSAGHLASTTKFAEMLIDGQGGVSDIGHGMKILKSAAEQGHVMARIKIIQFEQRDSWNILRAITMRIKVARMIWSVASDIKKPDGLSKHPEFWELR